MTRTPGSATTWTFGPAWLFCPADRPDRYRTALERADVVVLDLEDAVAPDRRGRAREAVRDLLAGNGYDHARTVLRVNGAGTADHAADLRLLEEAGIGRVMLAKTERRTDLDALADRDVVALLETPVGIERAGELVRADNVVAVMWGADDLVAGLGGTSSRGADGGYRDVARYARSRALVSAKAYGRSALDAVYMDIPDLEGLRAECEDAVAVGFDAKVAVHPSQVSVIRTAFVPSPERVAWARRLLEAVAGERGVTTFEGQMVDGPIFAQAEQVLRRAGVSIPDTDT